MKIELFNNDCIEVLKGIEDKTIDLVLIDPPYNINKAEWDKIDGYIEWIGGIFKEISRVLKDNGSFYFFHNDFLQIVEIQNYINKNIDFNFKRLLIWNKKFKGAKIESYLQRHLEVKQLRNYKQMTEYCLYYVKSESDIESGKQIAQNDIKNFRQCRQYFKELHEFMGKSKNDIIKEIGGRADHLFRYNSSQWSLCTKETYQDIVKAYNINKWEKYLKYEDVVKIEKKDKEDKRYKDSVKKYNELRYTFNNQETTHDVINCDIAEKQGHITPKPVELLETLIKHSSNENDTVLDCFMGSGSTGVACSNLNRRFIGIELDKTYFDIARERIDENQAKETD